MKASCPLPEIRLFDSYHVRIKLPLRVCVFSRIQLMHGVTTIMFEVMRGRICMGEWVTKGTVAVQHSTAILQILVMGFNKHPIEFTNVISESALITGFFGSAGPR